MKSGSATTHNSDNSAVGQEMYRLMVELFPICRSITGNGVRETLARIKDHIPLEIHEVPSGTKVFDWEVPKEWNIRNAFIINEEGNKVVDFKKNNLHVVGYSIPVDKQLTLAELQGHLHSLPEQPDAIPYVTSYYKEYWGFCISHNERKRLKEGRYRVVIDSELKDGFLTYGEYIVQGKTRQEVFLSTYVCHPSMANNELSGPVLTTFLAKWIVTTPRRYTYRIVFVPETIGSITYLSRNLDEMQNNIIAGFNISCVGDERAYSYVPSRYGNTFADKVALNVLKFKHPDFIKYSFLDRGSDERQYCSPGVDLPLVTLTRSKYGAYPEYHTSLDNLDLVTPKGLMGSYELFTDCIQLIERNAKFRINCYAEPQLGKRGLYPNLSTKTSGASVRDMMNFIAYADGSNDLINISNTIGVPAWELYPIVDRLLEAGLLLDLERMANPSA
jgi:aminopeptidase-like protein